MQPGQFDYSLRGTDSIFHLSADSGKEKAEYTDETFWPSGREIFFDQKWKYFPD